MCIKTMNNYLGYISLQMLVRLDCCIVYFVNVFENIDVDKGKHFFNRNVLSLSAIPVNITNELFVNKLSPQ